MNKFAGVYTALITPFQNGDVDFSSLRKLVRWQLDQGVQGFVVSGTTAESPTLTTAEKEKIFEFVSTEVSQQVPILIGTGTNNTETTIEATQRAERLKADGALIVTPYYNKPPQRGLVAHYKKIAENTELPILLYNVPGRTASNMSVETVAELSRIPNIVGIKEASGDLSIVEKLVEKCRPGFSLISGDDETYLEFMTRGGVGVISVLSHVIPKQMINLVVAAKSPQAGREIFAPYVQLTRTLFAEANPIPVKAALKLMGSIASDELRLPLVAASEAVKADLARELAALGVQQ